MLFLLPLAGAGARLSTSSGQSTAFSTPSRAAHLDSACPGDQTLWLLTLHRAGPRSPTLLIQLLREDMGRHSTVSCSHLARGSTRVEQMNV